MGHTFRQLSLEERIEIFRFRENGMSLRGIARAIGRYFSTISSEVKRNSKQTMVWRGGYAPTRAEGLTKRRRRWGKRFKLSRNLPYESSFVTALYPKGRLRADGVVTGTNRRPTRARTWSHNYTLQVNLSICLCSYRPESYWHRLLPRKKHRRGHIKRGGVSAVKSIKHRVSVHERTESADDGRESGHWETGFMLFSKYGQAVLVNHERTSRIVLANIQPSKHANPVVDVIKRQLGGLPKAMRRTITFENGTENAYHHKLRKPLKIKTYFCDVRSPWQKGGVENAIGRLRRVLPRQADMSKISQTKLNKFIQRYYNTPRKMPCIPNPGRGILQKPKVVALQT